MSFIKGCLPKIFSHKKGLDVDFLPDSDLNLKDQSTSDVLNKQHQACASRKVSLDKHSQGKDTQTAQLSSGQGQQQTQIIQAHKSLQSELSFDLPHQEQFKDHGLSINFLQIIGSGGSSTVYKGQYNGLEVAVKVVLVELNQHDPSSLYNKKIQQKAIKEAELSKMLDHKNVVKTYEFFETTQQNTSHPHQDFENNRSQLNMIQEYCNLGDLPKLYFKDVIYNKQKNQPNLEQILYLALDIAEGLNYIHMLQVIHGDMKTSNVLLQHCENKKRIIAKIGDFGMSCRLPQHAKSSMWVPNFGGTKYYAAPEVAAWGKKSQLSDIFSYGIILWELYQQQTAVAVRCLEAYQIQNTKHYKQQEQEQEQKSNVEVYRFPWECPPPYCLLSWWCQEDQPCNRPSSAEIVKCLQAILKACKKKIISIGMHNKELNMELGQTFLLIRSKHQVMPFMEIITMLCSQSPHNTHAPTSTHSYTHSHNVEIYPQSVKNLTSIKTSSNNATSYRVSSNRTVAISQKSQNQEHKSGSDPKTDDDLQSYKSGKKVPSKQSSPQTKSSKQNAEKACANQTRQKLEKLLNGSASNIDVDSNTSSIGVSNTDTPSPSGYGSMRSQMELKQGDIQDDLFNQNSNKLGNIKVSPRGVYLPGPNNACLDAPKSGSQNIELIFKDKAPINAKSEPKPLFKSSSSLFNKQDDSQLFHTGSSYSFSSSSKKQRQTIKSNSQAIQDLVSVQDTQKVQAQQVQVKKPTSRAQGQQQVCELELNNDTKLKAEQQQSFVTASLKEGTQFEADCDATVADQLTTAQSILGTKDTIFQSSVQTNSKQGSLYNGTASIVVDALDQSLLNQQRHQPRNTLREHGRKLQKIMFTQGAQDPKYSPSQGLLAASRIDLRTNARLALKQPSKQKQELFKHQQPNLESNDLMKVKEISNEYSYSAENRKKDIQQIQGALSMLNMNYGRQSLEATNYTLKREIMNLDHASTSQRLNNNEEVENKRSSKIQANVQQLSRLIQEESKQQQIYQIENYFKQKQQTQKDNSPQQIEDSLKHLEFFNKLTNLQQEYQRFINSQQQDKESALQLSPKRMPISKKHSSTQHFLNKDTQQKRAYERQTPEHIQANLTNSKDLHQDLRNVEKDFTKNLTYDLDNFSHFDHRGISQKVQKQFNMLSKTHQPTQLDNLHEVFGNSAYVKDDGLKGAPSFDFEIPKLQETYPDSDVNNSSLFQSSTNKGQQIVSEGGIDQEHDYEQDHNSSGSDEHFNESENFNQLEVMQQHRKTPQRQALSDFVTTNKLEIPILRSCVEMDQKLGQIQQPQNSLHNIYSKSSKYNSQHINSQEQRKRERSFGANQVSTPKTMRTITASGSGSVEDARALLKNSINMSSPQHTASFSNNNNYNMQQQSNQNTFTSGYETYDEQNLQSTPNSPNTQQSNTSRNSFGISKQKSASTSSGGNGAHIVSPEKLSRDVMAQHLEKGQLKYRWNSYQQNNENVQQSPWQLPRKSK